MNVLTDLGFLELKRNTAGGHRIEETPIGPYVNTISIFPKYLRRHILQSPNRPSNHLTPLPDHPRTAKITNLNLIIIPKQNILRLHIPMHNKLPMDRIDALRQL